MDVLVFSPSPFYPLFLCVLFLAVSFRLLQLLPLKIFCGTQDVTIEIEFDSNDLEFDINEFFYQVSSLEGKKMMQHENNEMIRSKD